MSESIKPVRPKALARLLWGVALLLLFSCASFKRSPEWNPDLSAPSSPSETWTSTEQERAPRSLDDLLSRPDRESESRPSDSSSVSASERILQRLEAQVPESSYDAPLDLAELIDVALENNPRTRESWQASRAAAARLGESMGSFYPSLAFQVSGGAEKEVLQFPAGTVISRQAEVVPELQLTYVLLDFGRRSATADMALRTLQAANYGFNRELQRVIYDVQASFYEFDAARALEAAAERNLELAASVKDDVGKRLDLGLSTRPEWLLAKQADAQAVYDLESSKVGVSNARAKLALSLGLPANAPLHIVEFWDEPLPSELDDDVDELIDLALTQRPDLQAQVARLRASEARLDKAQADFFPVIGLEGSYGGNWWRYRLAGGGPGNPLSGKGSVQSLDSIYQAMVVIEWPLFEGFSRLGRMREAQALKERERQRQFVEREVTRLNQEILKAKSSENGKK